MGFKTALYAVGPGVPADDLRAHAEGGAQAAAAALARWFPDTAASPDGASTLAEGGYPGGEDTVYVATFGPTTVFGGMAPMGQVERLGRAAAEAGLMTWQLMIHSVVDLCQFEVHRADGSVLRSFEAYSDKDLADSRDDAVGDPLPFEAPYWAGEHREDDEGAYDPFHPLELGEAAIAWMFATSGEGAPDDAVQAGLDPLLDAFEVPMHGFRLGG
jgi:hypothetical protein